MLASARSALWCGGIGVAVVCAWLADVTGHGLPKPVLGALVVLAAITTLAWCLGWMVRVARRREGDPVGPFGLTPGRLLLILLLLALAVRFTGLDHELAERYYADEGYYTRHASEINTGQLLVPTFNYPHLLYYLDALAIWTASLASETAVRAAGAIYQVPDWPLLCRLLARGVVALLSALTVIPVFRLGERLGGLLAGGVAGALIVLSPLLNEGSHLAICDGPSTLFVALTLLFVARLLEKETLRDYLWAGVAAGLAAGTKYPAGLVAIAILAVWVRWRLRERSLRWGLLWAGLASIGTLLATTPSLLFLPELAWRGERGLFWGLQVYGGGGWIGVMPPSNALYYAGLLNSSFGSLALLAGLAGLATLGRQRLVRLAWLLPFPVVYLSLICRCAGRKCDKDRPTGSGQTKR